MQKEQGKQPQDSKMLKYADQHKAIETTRFAALCVNFYFQILPSYRVVFFNWS